MKTDALPILGIPENVRSVNLPGTVQAGSKLLYLESIRGLAALIVVIHHLLFAFWPEIYRDYSALVAQDNSLTRLLGATPLGAFHNGSFSVRLFFVLSGFVLSFAFIRTRSAAVLTSAAIRRYTRLMIPALASVMISWVLIKTHMVFAGVAANATGRPSEFTWLQGAVGGEAASLGLWQVLKHGVIGIFVNEVPILNSALWTMPIELLGSFVTFSFLALFGKLPRRWLFYVLLAVLLDRLNHIYVVDFLLGMCLCEWFNIGAWKPQVPLWVGIPLLAFGFFVGGTSQFWFRDHGVPVHFARYWPSFGAATIISASLFCVSIQRILEHRFFTLLGRLSFPIYVVHMSIICSMGCWFYVEMRASGKDHLVSGVAASVISLAFSYFAAWVLYYIADLPSIRLGKILEQKFFTVPAANGFERTESRMNQ